MSRSPQHLGPYEAVRQLRWDAEFPELLRVRRRFEVVAVSDIERAVFDELSPLRETIAPGMRIAITVGSRGIANIVEIITAVGAFLKQAGGEPFVVAAMGSHGGGDAVGQRDLLSHIGITESTVSMPIAGSDELVEITRLFEHLPVVMEKSAFDADAILAVNRIKPHTDFHGPVESGLAKILAIGLGKQLGASALHATGPDGLAELMPIAARTIVDSRPVLGGLAILENEEHGTGRLVFVAPEGIAGDAERALLEEARASLPMLPFDELEVLVVNELGKDKSGTGIDPNVIGRMRIEGTLEPTHPRIAIIVALALSEGSGGNALGFGLADLTTLRAIGDLDLSKTFLNSITAGLGGIRRGALPVALATERDAIAAGLSVCGETDPAKRRVVCIRDTLSMGELLVSSSLGVEVDRRSDLEVIEELGPMRFSEAGDLLGWGARH